MSKRPRRDINKEFFDVFADMPFEVQAAALKLMEYEHYQAERRERSRRADANRTQAATHFAPTNEGAKSVVDPVDDVEYLRRRKEESEQHLDVAEVERFHRATNAAVTLPAAQPSTGEANEAT